MTGQQQIAISIGGTGEGVPQNQSGGVNVNYKQDGTCTASTNPSPLNWYSRAPETGVGYAYWIKAVDTGLSSGTAAPLTGPSISGFTNIGISSLQVSIPSGIGGRNYSYQIANNSSGSPVLASGTGNINNSV